MLPKEYWVLSSPNTREFIFIRNLNKLIGLDEMRGHGPSFLMSSKSQNTRCSE